MPADQKQPQRIIPKPTSAQIQLTALQLLLERMNDPEAMSESVKSRQAIKLATTTHTEDGKSKVTKTNITLTELDEIDPQGYFTDEVLGRSRVSLPVNNLVMPLYNQLDKVRKKDQSIDFVQTLSRVIQQAKLIPFTLDDAQWKQYLEELATLEERLQNVSGDQPQEIAIELKTLIANTYSQYCAFHTPSYALKNGPTITLDFRVMGEMQRYGLAHLVGGRGLIILSGVFADVELEMLKCKGEPFASYNTQCGEQDEMGVLGKEFLRELNVEVEEMSRELFSGFTANQEVFDEKTDTFTEPCTARLHHKLVELTSLVLTQELAKVDPNYDVLLVEMARSVEQLGSADEKRDGPEDELLGKVRGYLETARSLLAKRKVPQYFQADVFPDEEAKAEEAKAVDSSLRETLQHLANDLEALTGFYSKEFDAAIAAANQPGADRRQDAAIQKNRRIQVAGVVISGLLLGGGGALIAGLMGGSMLLWALIPLAAVAFVTMCVLVWQEPKKGSKLERGVAAVGRVALLLSVGWMLTEAFAFSGFGLVGGALGSVIPSMGVITIASGVAVPLSVFLPFVILAAFALFGVAALLYTTCFRKEPLPLEGGSIDPRESSDSKHDPLNAAERRAAHQSGRHAELPTHDIRQEQREGAETGLPNGGLPYNASSSSSSSSSSSGGRHTELPEAGSKPTVGRVRFSSYADIIDTQGGGGVSGRIPLTPDEEGELDGVAGSKNGDNLSYSSSSPAAVTGSPSA